MTLLDKAMNKPSPRPRPNQSDPVGLASTSGLTLEKVLENQAASPFSLREFSDYLEQTYCAENLSFYMAVIDYRESARLYFGGAPDNVDDAVLIGGVPFQFLLSETETLNHEHQIRFETLRAKFKDILERFILTNAPQEVNIPCELRIQLLQLHRDRQSYHPALLRPAFVAVVELLRISAFIPFATDRDRLLRATSASSAVPKASKSCDEKRHQKQLQQTSSPRRLRSSPALTHSGNDEVPSLPIPPVPPLPRSADGKLLSPRWFEFDEVSTLSSTSTAATVNSATNPAAILKKLTTSLRFRARSQSPPRVTGWKQIVIPDPSLFMNPSTPTKPAAAVERTHSNGSVISSSSTESSHGSTSATLTVDINQQVPRQLDTPTP